MAYGARCAACGQRRRLSLPTPLLNLPSIATACESGLRARAFLADGGCSAKELENTAICSNKLTAPSGAAAAANNYAAYCAYYKEMMACYTKCHCEDAGSKSSIDGTIASLAGEPYNCKDIQACISAAVGLRASAFTVFVAAAAALVAVR